MKNEKLILLLQDPFCSNNDHQNSQILRICTEKDCPQKKRLLCGHCILSHASHPDKLILIKDFVNKTCQNFDKKNQIYSENKIQIDKKKQILKKITQEKFTNYKNLFEKFLKENLVLTKNKIDGLSYENDDIDNKFWNNLDNIKGKPLHMLS